MDPKGDGSGTSQGPSWERQVDDICLNLLFAITDQLKVPSAAELESRIDDLRGRIEHERAIHLVIATVVPPAARKKVRIAEVPLEAALDLTKCVLDAALTRHAGNRRSALRLLARAIVFFVMQHKRDLAALIYVSAVHDRTISNALDKYFEGINADHPQDQALDWRDLLYEVLGGQISGLGALSDRMGSGGMTQADCIRYIRDSIQAALPRERRAAVRKLIPAIVAAVFADYELATAATETAKAAGDSSMMEASAASSSDLVTAAGIGGTLCGFLLAILLALLDSYPSSTSTARAPAERAATVENEPSDVGFCAAAKLPEHPSAPPMHQTNPFVVRLDIARSIQDAHKMAGSRRIPKDCFGKLTVGVCVKIESNESGEPQWPVMLVGQPPLTRDQAEEITECLNSERYCRTAGKKACVAFQEESARCKGECLTRAGKAISKGGALEPRWQ